MPANNEKIIGIDLGTTNSVLGVIQNGAPILLPIGEVRLLPSIVGVSPQNELVVGTPARNQWVVAPDRTVRSIKRKMGKDETVEMAGKSYTPQEFPPLFCVRSNRPPKLRWAILCSAR